MEKWFDWILDWIRRASDAFVLGSDGIGMEVQF